MPRLASLTSSGSQVLDDGMARLDLLSGDQVIRSGGSGITIDLDDFLPSGYEDVIASAFDAWPTVASTATAIISLPSR
jgi:hypothetical protein